MTSTKQIVGIIVAVVVVMIIAFVLTTIQQDRSAKAAQCVQMLGQINQQADQYNGMCGSGLRNYAGQ
jgi:hypothetical protein